ncbi:MAG TPA: wax ester/triacylglycerol synthase family O-acyltransferase, partial [Ilumatobacter sp.]
IGGSGRRRRRTPASTEQLTRRANDQPAPTQARAPRLTPHRLSALDASFLEAETPRSPMHVGALMMLAGDPLRDARGELRMDEIRAAIAAQLPRSPRMRQTAVPVPFARPVWEDAPTFDIAHHVRHIRVPPPGTRAELEALCCELQMQLLDRTKPLWEMWFVDGLVDGAVGLVYKVHHAVVDGVSAAETFEVLLGGGNPIASSPPAPASGQVQRALNAMIDDAGTTVRLCLETGARLATNPARAVATVIGLGRLVRPSAIAPHTTLNRPIGDRRRLLPVSFDLAELKVVAHRYDASVNDLVLMLVGAGLQELLESRGDRVDHVQVLVPVSLRGDTEHDGVGNLVGALLVPIGIERDPAAALAEITAATRSRKAGPEAVALDLLLRSSDGWPVGLLGPASRRIVHRQPFVNLVVTNVRGTQQPLSLLGSRITEIIPVVPLGGNLTLGVAALSYAGRLVLGLHADADACPDVDLVAHGIERAFRDLGEPVARPPARRRSA